MTDTKHDPGKDLPPSGSTTRSAPGPITSARPIQPAADPVPNPNPPSLPSTSPTQGSSIVTPLSPTRMWHQEHLAVHQKRGEGNLV
jgi:hypothetical protein